MLGRIDEEHEIENKSIPIHPDTKSVLLAVVRSGLVWEFGQTLKYVIQSNRVEHCWIKGHWQ